MDLSLDDYMKTKRVRPGGGNGSNNNINSNGRRGGGVGGRGRGRQGVNRPFLETSSQKNISSIRNDGNTKGSALSRLGKINKFENVNQNQTQVGGDRFKTKPLAMDTEKRKSADQSSGGFKVTVYDARQKIGNKLKVTDARMKIKNKARSDVVDARQRIKAKQKKPTTLHKLVKDPQIDFIVGDDNDEDYYEENLKSKPIKRIGIGQLEYGSVSTQRVARLGNLDDIPSHSEGHLEMATEINEDVTPLTRTVSQEIARPFDEDTDLTIVRNFRPSLASFSADDGTYNGGRSTMSSGFAVHVSRKVPVQEQIYRLPDYADLLQDTKKKLDAGLGDLYYGKMQADQEAGAIHTRVQKVQFQRTLPVESPVITINNEKMQKATRSRDPSGIVALPARRKQEPKPLPRPKVSEPMETETGGVSDNRSPLQGFKVSVTNLHPAVTQDDIVELFASIGPLKKAKLLKRGNAEVVFVSSTDALTAVKRYHNRLLDNMPMYVKCLTAAIPARTPSISLPVGAKLQEPETVDIDPDIVHKAVFRNKEQSTGAQPVQFLVKI